MKRRDFIKTSVAASTIAGLGPVGLTAAAAERAVFDYGPGVSVLYRPRAAGRFREYPEI